MVGFWGKLLVTGRAIFLTPCNPECLPYFFFVRFQGLDEESGAKSVRKVGLKFFTIRAFYCDNKDNQILCMHCTCLPPENSVLLLIIYISVWIFSSELNFVTAQF